VEFVGGREAVAVAPHRLAVDRGRCRPQPRHSLADAGIAIGPVDAIAGEQAHPPLPLAGDQAVAIMLDLVNLLRSLGRLGDEGRDAGLDEARRSPLGRPFVIENRSGAAGNIATEAAVRAPAD
jgi:hypothetical protein